MPTLIERPATYMPNKRYAECCQLFDEHVNKPLYPRFLELSKRLMANRVHNSTFVKINLWRRIDPLALNFRITFLDGLLDDSLCTKEARADVARHGAMHTINRYRSDPSQDLFVATQAEYVHQVIDTGRQAYNLAMDAILDLGKHPAFEENGLDLTLNGTVPTDDAKRAAFSVHFHALVHRGWTKCPTCGFQIPDLPGCRDAEGQPICLDEACRPTQAELVAE